MCYFMVCLGRILGTSFEVPSEPGIIVCESYQEHFAVMKDILPSHI